MAWKKEPSGLITRFTYRGGSDSLASRMTCDGEKILTREFFEYNSDHILVQTIQDNGTTADPQDLTNVTQRKIKLITVKTSQPHLGFPEIIEERDLNHQLLRKTVLSYNARGKISSQEIYDSQGQFRYRLTNDYDELGRVISKTNALGQTESYSYDAVGNKTVIQSGRVTTYHTYDFAGRLIQTTVEGDDGTKHTSYHKYNLKNQKISTIDPHGNEVRFTYDAFDNLLETHLPTSDVLKATYDAFGHQLSSTDASGHTTTRTYNARGKPTSVHHPDGTEEIYLYNSDGTLKTHIDHLGTSIEHTYDVQGRLIQKAIVSSSN
jgi:YD repeat-containing protein